jgi:uncharacterized protein (DUF1800 family)
MTESRPALFGTLLAGAAGAAQAKADDPTLPAPNELALLLNRTSFGIRDEEYQLAQQIGYDAWLERQLAYEALDDSALESSLATALPTLAMSNIQLIELAQQTGRQFQAVDELRAATLLRQLYSPKQLYEVMVEFWTNHFNVQHIDGPVRYFKTVEDRELIRRNALGRFGDLVRGDARSPAMLWYLDNYSNVVSGPNENYARELMELHTLGVNGGYNEQDVAEVARCFTGWTLTPFRPGSGNDVTFQFVGAYHDYGSKSVLGTTIAAGGGISDGDGVIELLLAHPSTARFVATKLVRRFVADDPPASLVDRVAATYTSSNGDIKSMLRTLLTSDEFKSSADQKFKRPVELVMSTLRTLNAQLGGNYLRIVGEQINTLGQLTFMWPTPDGYPDTKAYWTNTSALLNRWNFAFAAVEGSYGASIRVDVAALIGSATTPEALVTTLSQRLLRRPLAAADHKMLAYFTAGSSNDTQAPLSGATLTQRAQELIGLLLGSPYFQYR